MQYNLNITHWVEDEKSLREIRTKVFIEEQNVPEELEWDEFDEECIHILVTDNNKPIACGRLKADGHIGRMAVLKHYRNSGIGAAILKKILHIAKQRRITEVYLHAQTTAISFYEKQAFKTYSNEFMDAGIPHKTMKKTI